MHHKLTRGSDNRVSRLVRKAEALDTGDTGDTGDTVTVTGELLGI